MFWLKLVPKGSPVLLVELELFPPCGLAACAAAQVAGIRKDRNIDEKKRRESGPKLFGLLAQQAAVPHRRDCSISVLQKLSCSAVFNCGGRASSEPVCCYGAYALWEK